MRGCQAIKAMYLLEKSIASRRAYKSGLQGETQVMRWRINNTRQRIPNDIHSVDPEICSRFTCWLGKSDNYRELW